jgi:hypothetical protein
MKHAVARTGQNDTSLAIDRNGVRGEAYILEFAARTEPAKVLIQIPGCRSHGNGLRDDGQKHDAND